MQTLCVAAPFQVLNVGMALNAESGVMDWMLGNKGKGGKGDSKGHRPEGGSGRKG